MVIWYTLFVTKGASYAGIKLNIKGKRPTLTVPTRNCSVNHGINGWNKPITCSHICVYMSFNLRSHAHTHGYSGQYTCIGKPISAVNRQSSCIFVLKAHVRGKLCTTKFRSTGIMHWNSFYIISYNIRLYVQWYYKCIKQLYRIALIIYFIYKAKMYKSIWCQSNRSYMWHDKRFMYGRCVIFVYVYRLTILVTWHILHIIHVTESFVSAIQSDLWIE